MLPRLAFQAWDQVILLPWLPEKLTLPMGDTERLPPCSIFFKSRESESSLDIRPVRLWEEEGMTGVLRLKSARLYSGEYHPWIGVHLSTRHFKAVYGLYYHLSEGRPFYSLLSSGAD